MVVMVLHSLNHSLDISQDNFCAGAHGHWSLTGELDLTRIPHQAGTSRRRPTFALVMNRRPCSYTPRTAGFELSHTSPSTADPKPRRDLDFICFSATTLVPPLDLIQLELLRANDLQHVARLYKTAKHWWSEHTAGHVCPTHF